MYLALILRLYKRMEESHNYFHSQDSLHEAEDR